jgi:tRNA A-37 threonylcarbamoyl transferase component Bud32
MMRHEYQDMCWLLAPGFEALLSSVLSSPGTSIKDTLVTAVTRHAVAGRTFYVKQYRHGMRPLAAPIYLIRQPKSQREWRHAAALQARGLRVVPHLAYGERWSWRGLLQTTLITEGLAGFASLDTLPDTSANAIQRALGKLVRQMHEAGVLDLDICARNLLYSATTDACCLLDVDKLLFRKQLNQDQHLTNLACLHSYVPLTDAFYHGYSIEPAALASRVTQRARLILHRRRHHWARRCLDHKHEVTIKQLGGLKWYVRQNYLDESLERLLREPDQPGVIQLPFHSGKAAYREAFLAELNGAATSRPVAAADKHVLGLLVRGYLVMRSNTATCKV